MKNKTLLLARTLIKNGEGLNLKGSSTFTKIAILIVFAILIPSFMFGIAFVVTGLLTVLKSMGQEGVILSWGIAINSTIVFVFGIFYVISTFYFSSDVEMLLPLPLKPRQIVAAKFLVVTIYEYFTTAIFFSAHLDNLRGLYEMQPHVLSLRFNSISASACNSLIHCFGNYYDNYAFYQSVPL